MNKKGLYLTSKAFIIYNLIEKNTTIYWHLLSKSEKSHCKRLLAFGLLVKKPIKIRVNNKNKLCYELIINKEADFNPILEDETDE